MPKIVNNFEIDLRKIAGEDLKPEVDQLPETIPPPPPPPKDKVITFFRLIQHQTEFHLVLNQSEICNHNPNLVGFNQIQK